MLKEGIAVYNPKDNLERALQDAFHASGERDSGWLTSYECRLAAKALASLKYRGTWLDEENLFSVRANHIFANEMQSNGKEVVFVTCLLYLRDILENRRISSYLNEPIVFTSKAVAFYLLREYPLHLIIDLTKINSADFIRVGALYIYEDRVDLPQDALLGIKINDEANKPRIEQEIERINVSCRTTLRKAAVSQRDFGIWQIDRGIDLDISSGEAVQNKISKKFGIVYAVEPGDTGTISVLYDDGESENVNKSEFVHNFVHRFKK